jgi:2-dehydropantoate 2-reductase
MKTTIIGAGAMGSLFGGLLAEAGEAITLVDIRADHVQVINRKGLCIDHAGHRRRIPIRAVTDAADIGHADLVIVFVKATHTETAARTAARITGPSGMVLTLQNGMGNAETLVGSLPPSRVIAGTTAHGATFVEPGMIRHAGTGDTLIGAWSGADNAAMKEVADVFTRAGIDTRVAGDIRRVMWAKLLVNVGINAITALTGIKNGQLIDLDSTRRLAAEAVAEAVAVARACGVAVEGNPVDKVFEVARATGPNRSSMGQDVDNARPTEIAAINGYIVRTAHRKGVPVPTNRALTALVETLQAHY